MLIIALCIFKKGSFLRKNCSTATSLAALIIIDDDLEFINFIF